MHSRRTFLKLAAVTGAGALAGCKHVARALTPKPEDVIDRLLREEPKPAPPPQPQPPAPSAESIVELMRRRRQECYEHLLDKWEASYQPVTHDEFIATMNRLAERA